MSDSDDHKPDSRAGRDRRALCTDAQPLADEELPRIKTPGRESRAAPASERKDNPAPPRREPGISQWPDARPAPRKAAVRKRPREEPPAHPSVRVRHPRRWPWVVLAIVAVLFLVTWVPTLVLRWADPPTTAFMLETAVGTNAGPVKHRWVSYDDIAPVMRLAVVASEDQTFPYNHGFDVRAIRKAIKHNERSDSQRGASTITQQTAKNLFLWPGGGYFRKGVEAWFTVLIDLDWPKWRVLEVYLNVAQFGPRIFGVEAAAEHYFGKHAAQLTAPEAALLAATLPDPEHLDPAHPSAYLIERQHWILAQMKHLGPRYLEAL